MAKDRCYILSNGLRVRATKKPDKLTEKALQDLFNAARAYLSRKQLKEGKRG